jgi:hypothetical protein
MNTLKMFCSGALLLFASLFLITSCNDDDDDDNNGNVRFEITDGPIDDPEVTGFFVTVVGVQVDGQPLTDFEGPLTFNLMDYRDGEVKRLGFADLDAGTYSDVRLLLDYNRDANGNAPGVYVQTTGGAKQTITTSTARDSAVSVTGNFTVDENDSRKEVVIDFDLRKSLVYSSGGTSKYTLVTDAELDQAARLVAKENTGTIEGDFEGDLEQAGTVVVVYAYRKGTYSSTERQGTGTSRVQFKNAVTSAVVDGNEEFRLSFLPEGTYELYFVGYQDTNNDGKLEMKGSLQLDILGNINPNNVTVKAGAKTDLNLKITGILPF